MGFGDLTLICHHAALPWCPLLKPSSTSGQSISSLAPEAGIQPICYSRTIELANTTIYQGAAAFVHIAALVVTLIMIFHVRSKFTAVGRREFTTFLYIFFVLSFVSLVLDAGVVPPGNGALAYFAAGQIALASALCMSLFINGLVGFQVYEDGTRLSVWLLRIGSTVWGAIVGLVALLTFEDWAGLGSSNTLGLFVLMYILNALLLVIWLGMQVLLVVGTLQNLWPLGAIAFAVLFFVVGQTLLYTVGYELCEQVQHYFDGLFIASLTNLLAVMMVYKYWDSITAEDLEFSVGARGVGNWDISNMKDPSSFGSSRSPLNERFDEYSKTSTYRNSNPASPNTSRPQSHKLTRNSGKAAVMVNERESSAVTEKRMSAHVASYSHSRGSSNTNLMQPSSHRGNEQDPGLRRS